MVDSLRGWPHLSLCNGCHLNLMCFGGLISFDIGYWSMRVMWLEWWYDDDVICLSRSRNHSTILPLSLSLSRFASVCCNPNARIILCTTSYFILRATSFHDGWCVVDAIVSFILLHSLPNRSKLSTTNKSKLYTTPTITHSIVIKICLQLNHVIHSLKWALGVKDSIVSDNNAFFDTLVHQHKGGDGAWDKQANKCSKDGSREIQWCLNNATL